MARLSIDTPYGTWRQASVNPLRRMIPNGTAITVNGNNRYSGRAVDIYGLTFEAWYVQQAIQKAFPDTPTKRNYAVDRNQRGTANLSDHAKGQAVDVITQKWDGKLGISKADTEWGTRLFDWLVEEFRDGRLPGEYVLFNHRIARRSEGWKVRNIRSGDPHRDHLHLSIRPGGPTGQPAAPKPPVATFPPNETRRTLRYIPGLPKMRGADVELVQRTIGSAVGTYGPLTKAAVKVWQKSKGIVSDGVVGPQTWRELDKALAQ